MPKVKMFKPIIDAYIPSHGQECKSVETLMEEVVTKVNPGLRNPKNRNQKGHDVFSILNPDIQQEVKTVCTCTSKAVVTNISRNYSDGVTTYKQDLMLMLALPKFKIIKYFYVPSGFIPLIEDNYYKNKDNGRIRLPIKKDSNITRLDMFEVKSLHELCHMTNKEMMKRLENVDINSLKTRKSNTTNEKEKTMNTKSIGNVSNEINDWLTQGSKLIGFGEMIPIYNKLVGVVKQKKSTTTNYINTDTIDSIRTIIKDNVDRKNIMKNDFYFSLLEKSYNITVDKEMKPTISKIINSIRSNQRKKEKQQNKLTL